MQMVQCLVMYVTEVGRESREIKWKSQKRKRFDRSSRVSRIFWIVGCSYLDLMSLLMGAALRDLQNQRLFLASTPKLLKGFFYLLGEKSDLLCRPHLPNLQNTPLLVFAKISERVDKNDFLGGSQTIGKMPCVPFGNK